MSRCLEQSGWSACRFKLIGRLVSYSSSGGGLNLIRLLFQTVSELKRYICSQYVAMEHTLAEKRRYLLRYTPKPHSHALNDVIMNKTHCEVAREKVFQGFNGIGTRGLCVPLQCSTS